MAEEEEHVHEYEYLGHTNEQRWDSTSSSVLLKEDTIVQIPLLLLPDVILFPGENLPLRILSLMARNMVASLLDQNHNTFGILRVGEPFPSVGTIVQARLSFVDESGDSIVGEGRQRFDLISIFRNHAQGILTANVRIRKELSAIELPTSLRKQPSCAYWPKHVYELFQGNAIVKKVQQYIQKSKMWSSILTSSESDYMHTSQLSRTHEPQDVRLFSYWLAANLPLTNEQRQEALEVDCPVRRLRQLLEILFQEPQLLRCSSCGCAISKMEHVFSVADVGIVGTFVNPGGYVHQMVTLRDINHENIIVDDSSPPTLQHTWFPGYAWSILNCEACTTHLGWRFQEAEEGRLHPPYFYGIRRAALTSDNIHN